MRTHTLACAAVLAMLFAASLAVAPEEESLCVNGCNGNGSCVGGECQCFPGYKGVDCATISCPGDCSGNGICTDGRCFCDEQYTGPDCAVLKVDVGKKSNGTIQGLMDDADTHTLCMPPWTAEKIARCSEILKAEPVKPVGVVNETAAASMPHNLTFSSAPLPKNATGYSAVGKVNIGKKENMTSINEQADAYMERANVQAARGHTDSAAGTREMAYKLYNITAEEEAANEVQSLEEEEAAAETLVDDAHPPMPSKPEVIYVNEEGKEVAPEDAEQAEKRVEDDDDEVADEVEAKPKKEPDTSGAFTLDKIDAYVEEKPVEAKVEQPEEEEPLSEKEQKEETLKEDEEHVAELEQKVCDEKKALEEAEAHRAQRDQEATNTLSDGEKSKKNAVVAAKTMAAENDTVGALEALNRAVTVSNETNATVEPSDPVSNAANVSAAYRERAKRMREQGRDYLAEHDEYLADKVDGLKPEPKCSAATHISKDQLSEYIRHLVEMVEHENIPMHEKDLNGTSPTTHAQELDVASIMNAKKAKPDQEAAPKKPAEGHVVDGLLDHGESFFGNGNDFVGVEAPKLPEKPVKKPAPKPLKKIVKAARDDDSPKEEHCNEQAEQYRDDDDLEDAQDVLEAALHPSSNQHPQKIAEIQHKKKGLKQPTLSPVSVDSVPKPHDPILEAVERVRDQASFKCQDGCNKHGICVQGTCSCDPGWFGETCAFSSRTEGDSHAHDESEEGIEEKKKNGVLANFYGKKFESKVGSCPKNKDPKPEPEPEEPKKECPRNCTFNGDCVDGKCVCHDAYTGEDCSVKKCNMTIPAPTPAPTPCPTPTPCPEPAPLRKCLGCSLAYGRCDNGTCICREGYEGVNCTEVSCLKNCSNHGACLPGTNGTCACHAGWSGAICDKRSCLNDCSGHGTCNDDGVCECAGGFSGRDCSVQSLTIAEYRKRIAEEEDRISNDEDLEDDEGEDEEEEPEEEGEDDVDVASSAVREDFEQK